jgi:nucleotide-binding universal stress UspA family protein
MKLAKILAPTDLSNLSRASVRYALEMAMAQGGEVLVYNVIAEDGDWFGRDDELDPAKALMPKQREQLAEFVREHCGEFIGKVTIREIVEVGVPYKEIVHKADEERVDMIVMSTHGRTGLDQLMMGSVTAKVVARAACPVLSMRPPK